MQSGNQRWKWNDFHYHVGLPEGTQFMAIEKQLNFEIYSIYSPILGYHRWLQQHVVGWMFMFRKSSLWLSVTCMMYDVIIMYGHFAYCYAHPDGFGSRSQPSRSAQDLKHQLVLYPCKMFECVIEMMHPKLFNLSLWHCFPIFQWHFRASPLIFPQNHGTGADSAPIIVWGQHVPDAGRSLRSCQCKTVFARWAVFKIPVAWWLVRGLYYQTYWGLK